MLRIGLGAVATMILCLASASAAEVKGKATKVDEKQVTVEGKDYTFAKDCKFFKQVKKAKEEIKDGAKADEFKTLPKKGLNVTLTTNDQNEVTELIITKKGKKKKTATE